MEDRARFLIDYATRHGPVTVRQLYYRAEVEGVPGIDKTESGYDKIQRQVLLLRRAGRLAYRHIVDLTRWMRKPTTFDSVEEALQEPPGCTASHCGARPRRRSRFGARKTHSPVSSIRLRQCTTSR
jgi:hypothetical protein